MRHARALVLVILAAAAASPAASAAADPVVTVVMSRLDNPRGPAFGPGGELFVAEAGRGGAIDHPCPPSGGQLNCYGLTGAVSRLWHGQQDRVVTGLPSLSFPQGASARGPHDIGLRFGTGAGSSALGVGGAHVTIGLEADPAVRDALNRPDLGKLVHIPAPVLLAPSESLCDHDCWTPAVDVAAFEIGGGPEPLKAESDPYGLLIERGGRSADGDGEAADDGQEAGDEGGGGAADVLTDASGNSLLRIDDDGVISTLAVFPSRGTTPPRSTDSVPTTVIKGPDGAYYVGELSGIPFTGPLRKPSNVYRVVPGQDPYHPTVFLDGAATHFNAIIDMAFQGGDLYIVQHWTVSPTVMPRDGKVIRIPCLGEPLVCDATQATTVLGGLDGPTSIAFDHDGTLYVTNHGASPAFASGVYTPLGEVLRVDGLDHVLGHGHGGDADDHAGKDH